MNPNLKSQEEVCKIPVVTKCPLLQQECDSWMDRLKESRTVTISMVPHQGDGRQKERANI
jgi:hypothetical protein